MEEKEEDEAVRAPPAPSMARLFAFVLRAMARHRGLFALCLLAALGVAFATGIFASLIPLFVQIILGNDGRFEGSPLTQLFAPYFAGLSKVGQFQALAVAFVAVAAIRALFSYGEGRVSQYMTLVVERDFRQRVFDEVLAADQGWVAKQRASDLYTVMHSYPRSSALIADQLLASLTKALSFAAIIYSLLYVSWELTLLAAALGIAAMLLVTRLRVLIRTMGRAINVQRMKLNQVSLEALQSMKVIRLFGREDHTRRSFLDRVKELQRQSYKRSSVQALTPQVQRVLGMVLFATLLISATMFLPSRDAQWVSTLTTFILVVGQLQTPMSSVSRQQTKILGELPAVEELKAFLESPKPRMKDGEREFKHLSQGLRFEGVSFAYDEASGPVLRDVTFDVPRGRMVALVGASGSGKSTTVQLIARLADPSAGRILVDGADLRAYRVASWRRRIAVVSQDTFLFNTTVRENIRFGRLDATDAEVEAAAKLADAHEFILQLERGYDTAVGDRGARLSGGQAQRIAIARALLADPDILILDEATSALDTVTERAVQHAIERASRERTVIAIAHRLSTIRQADEIVVLESGRVVERGTHEDLMAKGGAYAAYVRTQDLTDAAPLRREPRPSAAPPPRVLRLLVGAPGTGAHVVDDAGVERRVRLVAANGHASPPPGDVALVEAGAPFARVVLAGEAHERVPIFARNADGTQTRSRIASVRAPAVK